VDKPTSAQPNEIKNCITNAYTATSTKSNNNMSAQEPPGRRQQLFMQIKVFSKKQTGVWGKLIGTIFI
jgi:hypothetical protein